MDWIQANNYEGFVYNDVSVNIIFAVHGNKDPKGRKSKLKTSMDRMTKADRRPVIIGLLYIYTKMHV